MEKDDQPKIELERLGLRRWPRLVNDKPRYLERCRKKAREVCWWTRQRCRDISVTWADLGGERNLKALRVELRSHDVWFALEDLQHSIGHH